MKPKRLRMGTSLVLNNEFKIKMEMEDTSRSKSKPNELLSNSWVDLPIPFKVEPDSEERPIESYLDEVSAAVNANIAQIGGDLIESNENQMIEARFQMEALQRSLTGEKLKGCGRGRGLRRKRKNSILTTSNIKTELKPEIEYEPATKQNNDDFDDNDFPKCSVCRRVFNDENSLEEHIQNRTPGKILGCCACNKVFKDNSQLNVHFRKHTGEKPFECDQCDKKFSIKGNLIKHMRTHTGERRFECDTCNKKFMQFAHLNDHIKTHTGERPFNCDECNSAFKTKALLNKHMRTHNDKIVRRRRCLLRCRICEQVMKTTKQLFLHMKSHSEDEDPFKCHVCGKVYKTLFYLRSHQKMHEGIKPYRCGICGKSFVMLNQLRRHEVSHAALKPFQCDICFRPFSVQQNLKRHLLTHTGDKPYSCETCGKSFLTLENMTRHTRTHTGEKPYECDLCGRRFAHSTTVKEHRRTHTGDRPFGCTICNRRFTLSKGLFKHMRLSHPEFCETFQKVRDIPRQVRLQVAHNFDIDEYQEPDYVKSSDILSHVVKSELCSESDDDEVKPFRKTVSDAIFVSHLNKVKKEKVNIENVNVIIKEECEQNHSLLKFVKEETEADL